MKERCSPLPAQSNKQAQINPLIATFYIESRYRRTRNSAQALAKCVGHDFSEWMCAARQLRRQRIQNWCALIGFRRYMAFRWSAWRGFFFVFYCLGNYKPTCVLESKIYKKDIGILYDCVLFQWLIVAFSNLSFINSDYLICIEILIVFMVTFVLI